MPVTRMSRTSQLVAERLLFFEKPWFNVNTTIPPVVSASMPITHAYTYNIASGQMTVTHGRPPALFRTRYSTTCRLSLHHRFDRWLLEDTVISNVSATVWVPAN